MEFQILACCEIAVEAVLLRHHAYQAANLPAMGCSVQPFDENSTGSLPHESGENPDKGCFPGAVWPQQSKDASLCYFEVETVQSGQGAVLFCNRLSRYGV